MIFTKCHEHYDNAVLTTYILAPICLTRPTFVLSAVQAIGAAETGRRRAEHEAEALAVREGILCRGGCTNFLQTQNGAG